MPDATWVGDEARDAAWTGRERRQYPQRDGERLAVVENSLEELKQGQAAILKKLEALSNDLTKYKAFVGGVVWLGGAAVASVVTAWELFKDWILRHWN